VAEWQAPPANTPVAARISASVTTAIIPLDG
jgi:hypothetical protein